MALLFPGLFALASAVAVFFFIRWQKAAARAHSLEVELAGVEDPEALIRAREEALQTRLEDFEKQREEALQATRASVMQVGAEMSNKLLEDHKREAEALKKEQAKVAEESQRKFTEQFTSLTQSVAQIQKQAGDTGREVETVMRALTHPAGAGHLSEIGLENSLKNLGLEPGRDFMMQYHLYSEEGSAYRPDAVIFLPQDTVMVIDSKASKFWVALAEAQGTEEQAAVMQQFIGSMRTHIKALSQKQYGDEVTRVLGKQGRKVGLVFNVMYLPSDAAIEQLRMADSDLLEQCEKARLFMAGPASLQALFSLANQQISAAKRDENQAKIIEQVRELMASFSTAIGYVDALGKNLQGAAKKFDDFAKSVNKRVLPKMRTIETLGVSPAKNKALPQPIKSYEVISLDQYVDVEADDTEDGDDKVARLPNAN